jgi:hypothetical protein
MKITQEQLIQIIKEELEATVSQEGRARPKPVEPGSYLWIGGPDGAEYYVDHDEEKGYLYIVKDGKKVFIHPSPSGRLSRYGTTDGKTKVDLLGAEYTGPTSHRIVVREASK